MDKYEKGETLGQGQFGKVIKATSKQVTKHSNLTVAGQPLELAGLCMADRV